MPRWEGKVISTVFGGCRIMLKGCGISVRERYKRRLAKTRAKDKRGYMLLVGSG